MENRYIVILAAGKGSRMKSKLYKVLHPVAGKPMVEHVLDQTAALNPKEVVTIVGHGAERVMQVLGDRSQFALQEEQLGTGHAVQQAESILTGKPGTTLVICGDTPLLSAQTLKALMDEHETTGAKATILSANMPNPTGYGRIIRNTDGSVAKIVEQKDASEEEKKVTEINTGTYCFDNLFLFDMLKRVNNNNAQGEYYLPDVIELLKADNQIVSAYIMADNLESLGVNDRVALAEAEKLMRDRINLAHMQNGVTLIDPATTYIESNVQIGADTVIEPGVLLKGSTTIGSDCFIGAHSEIVDSEIGNDVSIKASRIEQAIVHTGSDVGPYGRLRPNAEIGPNVHIGNFVEVKNAKLGEGTKAGHLAYIGDATLGQDINIGCGAIFVNYDGHNKFHSEIGNNVFIGSNSNIVAPVKVADNAFIAAGSTINRNVPSEALAIARAKQINKEEYATKLAAFRKNN